MSQQTATPATDTFGNAYLEPDSRSAQLYARARAVMPGGNTRRSVFTPPYPAYAASAQGTYVVDVEGQRRLDFVNNYTALIHGHAHPRILEAVGRQLGLGTAVSFPTESEIRLAELLVERVASIEQLRFTNSGTEAIMMAIQAARAFTGRARIAKFDGCYHGAYENAEVLLPFNRPDPVERLLRQHASELAAVLVDPLPHRPGFLDPVPDFLPRLRQLTRELGMLLISDEIISFRLGYHGPQHTGAFAADLTTLGKIIGGGFPVGAFGGRADVMAVFDPTHKGPQISHAGTYNGNPVTMIAGYEAMTMLTPDAFDAIGALGQRLRDGMAGVFEARGVSWQVTGQGSLFKLHPHPRPLVDYQSSLPTPAEQSVMEQFYLGMLGNGIILTPDLAGALSTPMTTAHVDSFVETADRVFGLLDR
ncbi:MAG TPA: aspartate aminotransferase family protein [Chloroflexota bacterium]|nr:aspartate aminotransferase family protein [Chloroflexota bacterium]